MATELASLVVRLQAESTQLRADLDRVEQRLDRAAKSAEAFGKRMSQAGEKMTARVTLPLAAIGAASIKMASDAEEAANKFNVVMGAAADETRARLEELTETIPLTRAEMEEMAAGIQDMLVPMGVARTEAAGMSADMVQLAGDLASFNNVGTTQVLEAMQSALAGSSEPMRRFGVDTRETRLQALALEQGLISQGEKLDNTTRALAVLAAIQADSTDAMGDAARTVDSTANSFRFLLRDVKELAISIGQILIPMIQPLVAQLRDAVEWVKDLSESQQRMMVIMGLAAAAAGPLAMAIGTVTTAVVKLRAATLTLQAALGPAGWLAAGLGLVATAFLAFRQQAISAGDSLEEFRAKAALLSKDQLSDELTRVNMQLANIGETIKQHGGLEATNEATRTRFNQLLERARILGERLKEVRSVVENLDQSGGGNGMADALQQAADAAERIQVALDGITWPEFGDLPVGVNAPPGIQAPGTVGLEGPRFEGITGSLKILTDEADKAGLAVGDMSQATRLLTGEMGDFVRAIASGGVVGGIVAAIGSIVDSAERAARRIEQARQAVASAIDAYVDELANMDRFAQAEQRAIEGARDILQKFADEITAGIKSDKLREALEAQFDEAIKGMNLDQIREVLLGIGTDQALEVLRALERKLEEVNRLRAEEAERIREQAEALERKKVADRLSEIEAGKDSLANIIAQLIRNGLEQAGDERGLFEFDQSQWAEGLIEQLRQLRDAGVISADYFTRLVATINGQVITALEDFDRAAEQAAEAARAAAEAERFRQMVDLANLDLQILLAQGREREALLLRQEIALMEAVNAGRGEEYIAKLKQLHAIQLANQALQEQNATLARQAEATREATRAADGFVRAIGLSGETLALYRNRALRYGGAGDPFGLSSSTPNFSAAPASSSVTMNIESGAIQISVAPGEDPRAVGDAVYEQVKERFRRDRLRGVPNPFGGL